MYVWYIISLENAWKNMFVSLVIHEKQYVKRIDKKNPKGKLKKIKNLMYCYIHFPSRI